MKFLKLIYNPVAGDKSFAKNLDYVIDNLQAAGYLVSIYRSKAETDFFEAFLDTDAIDYDAIVVAGGDGTVNKVVNQMRANNLNIPLGIIPTGTANDLALHLDITSNLEQALSLIKQGSTTSVDLGKVIAKKDSYFINVCAGGLLADVAHQTERGFKNNIGKLAYYLKGIKEIPNFKALPFKISTEQEVFTEEISLFLILNGSSAGGFNQLGKKASVTDGLLDLILFKDAPINELLLLLIKVLQGNHISDKNIIYKKSSYFKLELLNSKADNFRVDIDGEEGPFLPLEVKVVAKGVEIFTK